MERNVRYFQEGNTIRKVYDFPERRESEKISVQPHRKTHRHTEKAQRMSLGMVLILAVSVLVSVFGCIEYLGAQAEVSEIKKSIAVTESELDRLKTQNSAMQYEIDSFLDVEYIVNTAKEELGMVMISEDQIVTYDSTRNEYMEQYGDVPSK